MATREHQSPLAKRTLLCSGAILVMIAAAMSLFMRRDSKPTGVAVIGACVEKLKMAHHLKSYFPAQRQTINLFHQAGLRSAALNAIGEEPREVRAMAGGNPEEVFEMLSHLGGLGEIIWVDRWTNFPVKLPATSIPGQVVVPRRAVVRAALNAIEASGGCLIKAGQDRTLVAKISEKDNYEAAIHVLGWLDGKPVPWDSETKANEVKAKPDGAASRSQPAGSDTNREPGAAGSDR